MVVCNRHEGAVNHRQNMSHQSLRGQLGLKSSALAPTACKLTSQYMVLDHMNSHYKKITNAKSSIDTSAPRALRQSQKMRDRQRQKFADSRPVSQLSYSRPISRTAFLNDTDDNMYDDNQWGNPSDEEETQVFSIMKDVLTTKTSRNTRTDFRPNNNNDVSQMSNAFEKTLQWPRRDSAHYEGSHGNMVNSSRTARPISARSLQSGMSSAMLQTSKPTIINSNKNIDGDLLSKRSHVFTEPARPFTPRTLKSNRSSRLADYKYYTPPPNKVKGDKKRSISVNDDTAKLVKNKPGAADDIKAETRTESRNEPQPAPKPRSRNLSQTSQSNAFSRTESSLTYETLQTRDLGRLQAKQLQDIPPLDISLDQDHMKWIKEQVSRGEHGPSGIEPVPRPYPRAAPVVAPRRLSLQKTTSGGGSRGKNDVLQSPRITAEEEALLYVEFISEVTSDILNRGIFTNKILVQVLENHVQRRKHELNERKMRSALSKLREDLGIPSDRVIDRDLDDEDMGLSSRFSRSYMDRDALKMNRTRDSHHAGNRNSTHNGNNNDSDLVLSGNLKNPKANDSYQSHYEASDEDFNADDHVSVSYAEDIERAYHSNLIQDNSAENTSKWASFNQNELETSAFVNNLDYANGLTDADDDLATTRNTVDQDDVTGNDTLSITQALSNYTMDIMKKEGMEPVSIEDKETFNLDMSLKDNIIPKSTSKARLKRQKAHEDRLGAMDEIHGHSADNHVESIQSNDLLMDNHHLSDTLTQPGQKDFDITNGNILQVESMKTECEPVVESTADMNVAKIKQSAIERDKKDVVLLHESGINHVSNHGSSHIGHNVTATDPSINVANQEDDCPQPDFIASSATTDASLMDPSKRNQRDLTVDNAALQTATGNHASTVGCHESNINSESENIKYNSVVNDDDDDDNAADDDDTCNDNDASYDADDDNFEDDNSVELSDNEF